MIDRYFERFPGISRYIADTTNSARELGYTTTLFGRKTHFPRLTSKIQHERQGAERAAINAPIRAPAPTSSSARWRGWNRRSPPPG